MKPFIQRSVSQGTNSLRVPSSVAIVFEIISGLQIIHLILKTMSQYASSKDKDFFLVGFVNYALSYLGEISPIDLFGEPNSLLMFIWIAFAVYFVIHLIMLAWLLIFGFIRPKENYPKLLKLMSWAYLVHSRLIFFVAHFFFLGLINSYNNCSIEGNTSFYCKAVWFAPTIILCILNVSIALIKELVLYQVLKNKDSYAVKNNLFHQTTLLYKGLIILLYFLIQDNTSRGQVCAIMNIVFVILLLMTDYMKFPFYNVKVLKASIAITGGILSFSVLALLQILGVDKVVLDIIWAAVIPLFVKSSLIIFEIFSNRIIRGEFNSPEKALYFISVLKGNKFGYVPNSLDDRNCSLGSIVSSGILVNQNFDFDKLKALDNWREYEERIYLHLVDRLTAILEKNSNSRVLLLTLANVCLKKLDNIPRTILLVKKLESLRLSLPVKTSLDGFNKKLNAYHTKAGDEEMNKHLNLLSHFEYKEKAMTLQKFMQVEVQKQIEFWDEMKKERVDVKKIIDISCDIDNNAFQVQRIFESKFRGFTSHFLNPLMLYGAYQELIKEYSDDARKLLKQFWSLARGQARGQGLDVYCEELGVAIISIEKNTMGSIIDTSGSMQTLFQVDKQKLLGQQLLFILPDFAANYLIKIIKNYAKVPSRKLEHTITTYGKQKDGNFFEVEVQLKLFPQIEREVKLMLMFRKIAQPKSIIIVNTEGIILDASDSLKQVFNISLQSKSVPTRFQDYAPDFDLINSAFNQEFSNEEGTAVIRSFSSKLPSVRSSRFTNNFDADQSFTRQQSMHHSVTMREAKKRNHSSKFAIKVADSKEFVPMESQSPKSVNNHYKEICAEYSQGGRILIKNFTNVFSSNKPKNDITFELQVSPCQLNGEVFKILTLTNTNNDADKKSPINEIGLLEAAKSHLVFSVAETGDSGFADQFSEVDEKNPNLKTSLHYSNKGNTLTVDKFTKKVTVVSEDGVTASQVGEKKQSAKTPDIEPFIQAHAPSKNRMSAKFAQSRSVSSTSSRTVASVKALKGAFSRDATFALSKRTTVLLLILVVLMIALGILNYSMSTKASSQVKTGVSIVNVASLRLSMAMRGWQFAVRIYLRYNKLRTGDIPNLQASLLSAGKQILEYNRQFTGNVSALVDKSLFSEIMAANVNLWELNRTFTTTGNSTDSVTASNILANKLMMTGIAPDYTSNYNRELIYYLCNNTANDYLVASNTLSAATQKMLQNTLKSNISNLQLVLGLEIAAVVTLCVLLVVVARIVIQLHQRLFRALVKIDERYLLERSYQLQKMKTLLAEDLEIRGYGLSIFEDTKTGLSYHASDKVKDSKSKGSMRKVNFHQRSDRISVLRLFIDLSKYVLTSLGVIQIITALFVVSLTRSLASFRNSQKITNQLSVTTQASSLSSVMVATTYFDMSFRNETNMLVSNIAPEAKLLQVMSEFLSVNNDIMAVFTEEGVGITDPFIQDLFQGTICSYIPDDSATQDYCLTGTNYNQLGLLAMNSKVSEAQNQYTTQYLANPTYDNAFKIINAYIAIIRPVADTLEVVYRVINSHIVGNFNDDNDKFSTQITLLHAAILVAIVFATFVILRVTISRFRFLDTRRGNILKVLSYKMLLEDKAIGFYLNKHFVSSDTAFTRSL